MLRWLIGLALLVAVWMLLPSVLFAQNPAPAPPPPGPWPPMSIPNDLKQFNYDPGAFLAAWKLYICWGIFLMWVISADWISRDCQERKLNFVLWNPIVFFTFFAAYLLMLVIPIFPIGFILVLIAYVAPLATYVVLRNAQADPHDKVFTPAHARQVVARIVNKFGGNMAIEKKDDGDGPDADLSARGADERQNNINLLTARQSPGFLLARTLLFEAVSRRAEAIRMEFSDRAVAIHYQIDGVLHNYSRQERDQADLTLAVLKTISNLNAQERVRKQMGGFGAVVAKVKYDCRIASQGTQNGEIAQVMIAPVKRVVFKSVEELGMRPKMAEQVRDLLGRPAGFFIISAPAGGGGLSTTFDHVMEATDRFMRNYVGVEDSRRNERDIENLPLTKFDGGKGETPMTVLPKLIRTYPDAFVLREITDPETLNTLLDQVKTENRYVVTSVRAKEAAEAVLRIMMLKGDNQKFAEVVTGALNSRLVRKLCDKCKEAYPPPADLLKQLGLPAGKIEAFYRPPSPPGPNEKVEICTQCQGVGYYGRTAIFELLIVDDAIRQILIKSPKLDLLRAAARKAGMRNLQEEGLLLLAKGVTSVPELVRALKG